MMSKDQLNALEVGQRVHARQPQQAILAGADFVFSPVIYAVERDQHGNVTAIYTASGRRVPADSIIRMAPR